LYVGNPNWDTTDESLTDWFGKCGSVTDAKIMTDRETGRSRGFGFVTMSTEEEAQAAIGELDGKELEGRSLKVNEALERKNRNQGYQDRGSQERDNRGGGRGRKSRDRDNQW
jgi:RNA recognition motif-containing protein